MRRWGMLVRGGQRRCVSVALHHKELIVWQKAHKLTLEVYSATKSFPKEETYGITSQLRVLPSTLRLNLPEAVPDHPGKNSPKLDHWPGVPPSRAATCLLWPRTS